MEALGLHQAWRPEGLVPADLENRPGGFCVPSCRVRWTVGQGPPASADQRPVHFAVLCLKRKWLSMDSHGPLRLCREAGQHDPGAGRGSPAASLRPRSAVRTGQDALPASPDPFPSMENRKEAFLRGRKQRKEGTRKRAKPSLSGAEAWASWTSASGALCPLSLPHHLEHLLSAVSLYPTAITS